MSVILITPDRYQTIRKTIRHLRAQGARDRLEVVVVAPSIDSLDLDEKELQDLLCFRVVEVGPIQSIGSAYAAGIRGACAPVVALAEDHSYPAPDWAEALIQAHEQPWAAVGPLVRNGNPGSMVGWADLLIAYGPWLEPAPAGEMDHLPGHNSSYKRAHLLAYGAELEFMLEAESVLHWDLRLKGYRLYLEPRAKTSHVNFTRLSSWISAQFQSGRMFAAFRARNEHWSLARRLFFTLAAPLIPVVRLRRILRELRRPGRPSHLVLRVMPALLVGLTADGAGQMLGYGLGVGTALQKLAYFEFHRYRHLRKDDRRAHPF
jgi:GT2 family glycosyltransferase